MEVPLGLIDHEDWRHIQLMRDQEANQAKEGSQAVATFTDWRHCEVGTVNLVDVYLDKPAFIYRELDSERRLAPGGLESLG